MTYEEYIKARKSQLHSLIESKIIHLKDSSTIPELLEESLFDYEQFISTKVQELYKETGLNPEPYEQERFIHRIKDKKIKQLISNYFFNLNILFETVHEITQSKAEQKREHDTLEKCLKKIPEDKRQEATSLLNKYITETGEQPQYIGNGESCTVFKIGNKVVKFGSKRRYPKIPFCLDIHNQLEYAPYQFMYITDKVSTEEISPIETEAMYRALRDEGYVWVDVKPDNIGKLNGNLKILDDVDIYTEQDALSQHRKSSVLEFVSYNMNLAILELKWLKSKNPSFGINDIDSYFQNHSNDTQENIDRIKDEYIRQTKSYTFNPNMPYFQSFGRIIEKKIAEQNSNTSINQEKNTK